LTEDPGQSCSIQVFDAECVNYFLIEQLKVVHFTFFIYFNLILFLQEPRRKGGQEENEHTTRHGGSRQIISKFRVLLNAQEAF
jgi:hypothetical protein